MNRKEPQPLLVKVINGKNVTVIEKGLNRPAVQIINKPAPPSPAPPPPPIAKSK